MIHAPTALCCHRLQREKEEAAAAAAAAGEVQRQPSVRRAGAAFEGPSLGETLRVHKSRLEREKEAAAAAAAAEEAAAARPRSRAAAGPGWEGLGGLGDLKPHKSRLEREKEAAAAAAAAGGVTITAGAWLDGCVCVGRVGQNLPALLCFWGCSAMDACFMLVLAGCNVLPPHES